MLVDTHNLLYKARRVGLILPALNSLADRNERVLLVSLYKWMDFAHRQIRRDLTQKYIKKDITTELTDWEFIGEQGTKIVKPAALKIMQTGGNQAYKILQAQIAFDVLNVEAVKAANKFSANLIREVTGQTKKGVRKYISTGIEAGKSMNKIARELKPLVGLTSRQIESVGSYRNFLNEKRPELSTAQVNKKVATYSNKTHRRRMQTIARTETARAQNIGYVVGLEDLGIEQVEFQISAAACEKWCIPLDGEKYKLAEGKDIIPVHPNCRCAMLPVVADIPACRMAKGIEKARCIPPDDLHDKQVEDLLKKLKSPKTLPPDARKIRRALRTLGHKGGLGGKPPIGAAPGVKPTVPTTVKPKKPTGKKAQRKWEKSLSETDKEEIWYWGKGLHADVHAAELGKPSFVAPGRTMADAKIYQKKFYRIIEDAPPTKIKVFRGSAFSEFEFPRGDYVVGKIVKFKSTTSTTSSEKIARKFMRSHPKKDLMNKEVRYLFEIDAKTAVDFRNVSTFKVEKELILRRGTQYSVEKVIQEKGFTRVLLKEVTAVLKPIKGIPTKGTGKKLTSLDKDILRKYSEGDYKNIIPIQLGGKHAASFSSSMKAKMLENAGKLEKTLLKLNGWKGTSYRGMTFSNRKAKEAFLAKLEKKGIYKAESFLATSKKMSIAEEYGKYSGRQSITMIIDGRSGRDIARYWGGTMKEVLFMKNSPFKVVKIVGDKVFLKGM